MHDEERRPAKSNVEPIRANRKTANVSSHAVTEETVVLQPGTNALRRARTLQVTGERKRKLRRACEPAK